MLTIDNISQELETLKLEIKSLEAKIDLLTNLIYRTLCPSKQNAEWEWEEVHNHSETLSGETD